MLNLDVYFPFVNDFIGKFGISKQTKITDN
jgi:hypothetical protein